MNWISDLSYNFEFKCPDNHKTVVRAKVQPPPPACEECQQTTQYVGFQAQKVKQTTVVEYDKNGRKAVAVRNKDGTMQYLSKTKLNYLKTGRVETQYTKEYQQAINKEEQKRVAKEQRAEASRRRTMDGHFKSLVSTLPDGEYVSDGVNVKPMKSKV